MRIDRVVSRSEAWKEKHNQGSERELHHHMATGGEEREREDRWWFRFIRIVAFCRCFLVSEHPLVVLQATLDVQKVRARVRLTTDIDIEKKYLRAN